VRSYRQSYTDTELEWFARALRSMPLLQIPCQNPPARTNHHPHLTVAGAIYRTDWCSKPSQAAITSTALPQRHAGQARLLSITHKAKMHTGRITGFSFPPQFAATTCSQSGAFATVDAPPAAAVRRPQGAPS